MALPDDDDNLLATLTVTIALDQDEGAPQEKDAAPPVLPDKYRIHAPISAQMACPLPPADLMVHHVSEKALEVFCYRLNLSAIGSMKNWEYLAAVLGTTNKELESLRNQKNPTQQLLTFLKDTPLRNVIVAIREIGRIDVLLAVRPYIDGLKASVNAINDSGMLNHSDTDSAMYLSGKINPKRFIPPSKPFILVTHNTSKTVCKSDYQIVKILVCSLKNAFEKKNYDYDILNIKDCIDETNIMATLESLFRNAKQIILYCTQHYFTEVAEKAHETMSASQFLAMKRNLHLMMQEEYMRQNQRITRFKLVVPDGYNRYMIPRGWPTCTLAYNFPCNYSQLCCRLFDSIDEDSTNNGK